MNLLNYYHYTVVKWCTSPFKNCENYETVKNNKQVIKYIIIKMTFDDDIQEDIIEDLNKMGFENNCHYLLYNENKIGGIIENTEKNNDLNKDITLQEWFDNTYLINDKLNEKTGKSNYRNKDKDDIMEYIEVRILETNIDGLEIDLDTK